MLTVPDLKKITFTRCLAFDNKVFMSSHFKIKKHYYKQLFYGAEQMCMRISITS